MNQRDLTKSQRRRLRELAALAHERELAAALASLEEQFGKWRAGEIGPFELNDAIHAFHNGPSRKLYNLYGGDPPFLVASAIVRGIVSEGEVGEDTMAILTRYIDFFREA